MNVLNMHSNMPSLKAHEHDQLKIDPRGSLSPCSKGSTPSNRRRPIEEAIGAAILAISNRHLRGARPTGAVRSESAAPGAVTVIDALARNV